MKKEKIDWSEKCWKEMLVYQRRTLWFEDTLDKLASWMDLKPGMTAVDTGCGLGYLGYTYWPYFGRGGRYIGVDQSMQLLGEAARGAQKWAIDGDVHFIKGDVFQLPLPDHAADWVMCQTLLMHLEEPARALAEMIRVTKPGGLVLCKEPDNVSPRLGRRYSSLPRLDIEEVLLYAKIYLLCNEGRIKLGRGDNSIGPKVAKMMKTLGLIDIDIRSSDKVFFLEPPYETDLQQRQLEGMKKEWFDETRHRTLREREKEEFLAGGGDPAEYERYREIDERILGIMRRQIEDGEFFIYGSGGVYVVKGTKPK